MADKTVEDVHEVETADEVEKAVGVEPAASVEKDAPASKAERLEAKAARLRAREEERRQAREARAAASERGGGSGGHGTLVTAAIAVLLSVGLAVSLFLLVQQHRDTDRAARRAAAAQQQVDQLKGGGGAGLSSAALDAARRYAVELASYDYRNLDPAFAKVAAQMTPTFRAKYLNDVVGLKAAILKYQGKAVATVQAAGISAVSPTSVTALLFLDQTVTSARSTTPTLNRNRVEMQLKLVNGTWLVDGLLLL